jgi:uncharacterized membrane protein (UPF0127 family)
MAFKRSAVRLRSAPPVSRQGFGNEALFSFERAVRAVFALLLVLAVALPAKPVAAQEAVTFDRTELAIVTAGGGRHQFKVDWAKSWPQKARGLMFRKEMPLDNGMLLDYDPPTEASIWMRNTLIPLDLVFISADGTIESIYLGAKPHDETPRPSKGPVRAVLELNAGVTRLLGIQPGDKVEHPIFKAP